MNEAMGKNRETEKDKYKIYINGKVFIDDDPEKELKGFEYLFEIDQDKKTDEGKKTSSTFKKDNP